MERQNRPFEKAPHLESRSLFFHTRLFPNKSTRPGAQSDSIMGASVVLEGFSPTSPRAIVVIIFLPGPQKKKWGFPKIDLGR